MSLRAKKFLIIFAGVVLLMNGAMASSIAHANTHSGSSTGAGQATAPPQNITEQERSSSDYGANPNELEMIKCGGFWDKLTVSCFVPQLVYYLLYLPASLLLLVTGEMFDFVLSLSIDRDFIDQKFVGELWTIVRDFSNMIFIFILLYTGIQTMFGLGGGWQKKISSIVIIALIINFSMFFSKIIIDAGNTLAVGVYSGMGVVKTENTVNQPHKEKKEKKEGNMIAAKRDVSAERDVSSVFVSAFQPQKFSRLAAETSKGSAVIIFLIAAIVSGYVAWVLVKASLMLVGRVIAFWFYMIISPFALISMVLPKGNIFDTWLYGLINQAMVAPVFLFFVYLIMYAVQGGEGENGILTNFGQATGSGELFDNIFVSIVLTGMIIYALNYALNVSKGLAGDFGKIGAQAATAVLTSFPAGMGAKLALGGAAMGLRATIGQGASKVLSSGALGRMSTAGGLTGALGRGLTRTAERAEKGTFDVRGTEKFKWAKDQVKSELGVDINIGKAGGKGGWEAEQKRRDKEDKERAKRAEVTVSEKAARAAEISPEYASAKEQREEHYQTAREATIKETERRGRAESIREYGDVKNTEKRVAETRSTAKLEGDRLAKRIDDLKKRQNEAVLKESKDLLQVELDQAEETRKGWDDTVKKAEGELAKVQKVYEQTAEYVQLREAEVASKMASDILKNTDKVIKDTEKSLSDWENAENERRREAIGRARTFPRLYFTRADHQEAVKKIRADKPKEVRDKEKKKKEVTEIFEEALKQVEKKDEGGGEEKGEKK